MTELRWSLVAVGLIIIIGVYLWSRRGSDSRAAYQDNERREPRIGDLELPPPGPDQSAALTAQAKADSDDVADTVRMTADTAVDEESESPPEPQPEPIVADKIIKLHVVSTEDEHFNAATVVAALRAEGLRFAHFDLFHRFEGEGNPGPEARPLFSVSDMLKPGTFNLETLSDTSMRGLTLFLALPGPEDAVATFADMLATGRRLAATLGGQLVDTQGCTISRQSASHLREDIINYQLSLRTQADAEESPD